MSPFDALSRRSVRAAAVSSPFPLGGVLPSTASAEGKPSLFGRFSGTMTPSEFSLGLTLPQRLLLISCQRREKIADDGSRACLDLDCYGHSGPKLDELLVYLH